MKPLQPCVFAAILFVSIFSHQYCHAQQDGNGSNPKNLTPADMRSSTAPANYTFMLLHLTGNTPGYVVLNNGKPVYLFKGIAVTTPNENNALVLTKQPDVEKAALLSIDKIKRGRNPALTTDEIQKIIVTRQTTPATTN